MSRTLKHIFTILIFCSSLLGFQKIAAQESYSIFPNQAEFALSDDANLFGSFDNRLVYFDNEGNTPKLWVSDGSEAGTFKISPDNQTAIRLIKSTPETLYFYEKRDNDKHFSKLVLGSDEFEIIHTTNLDVLREVFLNDAIYFVTESVDGGFDDDDLVKFDLITNTEEVLFTSDFGGIRGIGATDTEVYFIASMDDGKMLGKTDGTLVNTATFFTLYEGGSEFSSQVFMQSDGVKMYFFYNPGNNPYDLWISDGTEVGTSFLKSYKHPSSGLPPHPFAFLNDQFFFVQRDEGAPSGTTFDLHVTNGTSAGTLNLKGTSSGYLQPRNLTVFDGKVYFSSLDGNWSICLTDGTIAGTITVIPSFGDLNGGFNLGQYNGGLVVSARTNDVGSEIFYSDGTLAGTSLLTDVAVGSESSSPSQFREVGDLLFFSATTNDIRQLWVYDPNAVDCSTLEVSSVDILDDIGIGGIVSFQVIGGTPPYVYQLDGELPTADSIFTDLETGTYFLAIFDANGCMIEYNFDIQYLIGSVLDNSKIVTMTIYPNPNTRGTDISISLELIKNTPNIGLVLTDISGKVVYQNEVIPNSNTFTYPIPTKSMTAGTYLLSVLIDGEVVAVDKVILR
jgi:ELWxxDGT repeat protein